MPKKAVATLPNKIRVYDELGQEWHVDNQDELWGDVLKLTKNGTEQATLPLSVIIASRGWGWWSCFKTQDEWMAGIGVPVPDHNILGKAATANNADLAEFLQRFGGYVAFLEAQLGLLAGRRSALKEAYAAAVAVQTAEIDAGSEKAKEAQVLSESETLRQTKRLFIETDMLYETAKGLCAAYVRAYDATSRIVTIRTAEMELSPRGRA